MAIVGKISAFKKRKEESPFKALTMIGASLIGSGLSYLSGRKARI